MTYPVVKVVVTGDNHASVEQAREVIDRALTAAGFPPHRPRRLHLVTPSVSSVESRERPNSTAVRGVS